MIRFALHIYIAIKFRAMGITFGHVRFCAKFFGGFGDIVMPDSWQFSQVDESQLATLGTPLFNRWGIRFFASAEQK